MEELVFVFRSATDTHELRALRAGSEIDAVRGANLSVSENRLPTVAILGKLDLDWNLPSAVLHATAVLDHNSANLRRTG